MGCPLCKGTGVIETGNNDLPCTCKSGDDALFNVAGVNHPVTGKKLKKELPYGSPKPTDSNNPP